MKKFFVAGITLYQRVLSPDKGVIQKLGITLSYTCPYYPTCSEYTKEAIMRYGVYKGILKAFQRIISCHPWQKGGVDLP